MAAQRGQHQIEHAFTVLHGVLLRPVHGFDVIGKMLAAFRKVGEIPVRQLDHPALHILARQFDEVAGQGIADAATPGMQHHPDLIGGIQTDFDEVVSTTQRAHLVHPFRELAEGLEQLRVFGRHRVEPGFEGHGRMDQHPVVLMLGAAYGNITVDLIKDLFQRLFVEFVAGERQAAGDHAAADVDTHCRRNDRLVRGND